MHKENYSMCTDQSAREQELRDFIAWTKVVQKRLVELDLGLQL